MCRQYNVISFHTKKFKHAVLVNKMCLQVILCLTQNTNQNIFHFLQVNCDTNIMPYLPTLLKCYFLSTKCAGNVMLYPVNTKMFKLPFFTTKFACNMISCLCTLQILYVEKVVSLSVKWACN